jgi:hypothetical protein
MIDDECGAIGGIGIGKGNQSARRKLVPVPLCPQQIPHDLTWDRISGRRGGKPATNRLRYGRALRLGVVVFEDVCLQQFLIKISTEFLVLDY